jgi:hypothetical protein
MYKNFQPNKPAKSEKIYVKSKCNAIIRANSEEIVEINSFDDEISLVDTNPISLLIICMTRKLKQ